MLARRRRGRVDEGIVIRLFGVRGTFAVGFGGGFGFFCLFLGLVGFLGALLRQPLPGFDGGLCLDMLHRFFERFDLAADQSFNHRFFSGSLLFTLGVRGIFLRFAEGRLDY